MKTIYTFLICCLVSISYAQIDMAEYFIDTDPGIENGTPITINSPGFSVSESFSIDTTPLSNGIHTLFVRTRETNGVWSLYFKQTFLVHDFTNLIVPTQINAAEYFIDDIGNTHFPIPITNGFNLSETFSVDTTPLSNGIHTLYVRTRDEDLRWSLYFKQTFLVHDFTDSTTPSQIIAAEYFFDTDPGTDNGTDIAITPGFSVSESLAIPAALSDGIHTLYIRTKDDDDRWSLYFKQTFLVHTFTPPVQTQINKAEYFFDTDPGVNMGEELTITPGFSLNENIGIPTGSLAEGTHYLHIRTRDEDGNWSLYEVIEFEVTEALGIEDNILLLTRIYPVPAHNEITIDAKTSDIESITLFDIRGKKVNTFEVNSSKNTIDVSNYAKGTYILQVKSEEGLLNKKIVIE
ncbi:MAG TPA: T9SS type A sorting domain-containing protein [Flavobacteriaceae bacterium]|nr:T9SS type A sorting domain-containing protein [Flavobacteriaceae bacterium]